MRRMILVLVMTVVCVTWVGLAGSTRSPRYFPETGRAAIHQRALDLSGGAVVLAVALQPGYEDLPLLAYLRMAMGARVAVVYVTNGEATPGDEGGRSPVSVTGERKEEAFAASRSLDVGARFLNLPDPGVVGSSRALANIWGVDTACARLRQALLYYHPDVVLIEGDLRGDTVRSMRQQLLTEFLLKAMETSAENESKPQSGTTATGWRDTRLFLESEGRGRSIREEAYDRLHPLWRVSYRAIASEAAKEYRSLKLQLGYWMRRGDRSYMSVRASETVKPQTMVAGVPVVMPQLRPLGNAIRKLSARNNGGVRAPLLPELTRAIDTLDVHLARDRRSAAGNDVRLLAAWKNGLESLRCSLLDVKVTYEASESFVAERQLFYLKFEAISSRRSRSGSRIFFPGAIDHTWGVNESIEYQFSFQPPQQFEILTPEHMEYTVPASRFGIRQSTLRTRFSFILVHHDSVRQSSYIYRGEVLLRAGPKRTFEILTPVVRATDGQPVICRMMNISRDSFHGALTMRDTVVNPASKNVSLQGKDAVQVDTLFLSLRGLLPPGDHPISVSLPGGVQESVIARSFEARVDTQARVALLTAFDESPIAHALDRVGIPWRRINRSVTAGQGLARTNVIIIDRDALTELRGQGAQTETIMAWVREGGHLLVLPQNDVPEGGAWFIPGASFRGSPLLSPDVAVRTDSAYALLRSPNVLSEGDWDGWVVARSLCSVTVAGDRPAQVIVSTVDRDIPLVVTLPEGKGRITLIALDLISQLVNVHPGGHRIFANLLKP